MKRLLSVFLALLLWRPAAAARDVEPQEPLRLTVVATADFHGSLEPRPDKSQNGRLVGGIDIIAAYIEALRRENPGGVILLDAGDLYQGSLLAAASEGRVVVEFYNEIGYDAVAVGNHDFDFGPVGYHSVVQTPGEDPLGVLKQRLAQARFPFLAANIVERATGRRPAWPNLEPWTIVERRGVKVGVVGLISEDTPLITNPQNVESLRFEPLLTVARRELAAVRRHGAQVVILLVHAGIYTGADGQAQGPLAELARQLGPQQVDLIVAGHSHRAFTEWVGGVPVIQSHAKGRSLVAAELLIDRRHGRLERCGVRLRKPVMFWRQDQQGRPARFAGRPVVPLPHFAKRLAEYQKTISHLERIHLGRASEDLAVQTRFDSPMGNLVTDAMRSFRTDIDIAMYNSGGLRAPIRRGTITYGRLYEVVPFDNYLVLVTLSGEQLRQVIEHGLAAPYGVMEVSGLEVEVDPRAPAGKRCVALRTVDGRPVDPRASYRVATNDFVYRGGDGYSMMAAGRGAENTHRLVREIVATYIKRLKLVRRPRKHRYLVVGEDHAAGSARQHSQ